MGNGKKIRKVMERLNSLDLQANSLKPFLKATVMKMKAMLFSTLATVRHNWSHIKNPAKH